MEINQIQENTFVDIFGDGLNNKGNEPKVANFGGDGVKDVNLFSTETTTLPPTTDETTTLAPTTGETTTLNPEDVDIFEEKKGGRKPKYDFTDATGYFEDRIKSGKFVAVEETNADGTSTPFIPKSPEEFDEFIEIQVNTQIEQKKKDIEEGWYNTKSAAWKAVAKYAEMVDNPVEILPFIQGMNNIESVKDIDENDLEGAEMIVRSRLLQRGESQDIIDENIESLKTTGKLVSTAAKYKPLILQEETKHLQALLQQKKQEEQQYVLMVEKISESAIKAIDSPLFGKQKLKNDEKQAVYDLIGQPSQETGGYQIYNAIDSLFESGKFDTLAKIALLLAKEESFVNYVSSSAVNKSAEQLQKTLRAVGDTRTSSDNDDPEKQKPIVQRNQFVSRAKFGRG